MFFDMEKYKNNCLSKQTKMSKEEIQMIFKLRWRVKHWKMVMQGIYDKHECEVCIKNEETHKYVYECKYIWKIRGESRENIPKYENKLGLSCAKLSTS